MFWKEKYYHLEKCLLCLASKLVWRARISWATLFGSRDCHSLNSGILSTIFLRFVSWKVILYFMLSLYCSFTLYKQLAFILNFLMNLIPMGLIKRSINDSRVIPASMSILILQRNLKRIRWSNWDVLSLNFDGFYFRGV